MCKKLAETGQFEQFKEGNLKLINLDVLLVCISIGLIQIFLQNVLKSACFISFSVTISTTPFCPDGQLVCRTCWKVCTNNA